MKIRRIPLPNDVMQQMVPAERAFFLFAGHMQNELNSLNNIFCWCLSNSHSTETSPVESLAEGVQAMIYARILAGKLLEAWGALGKSFFNSNFAQRIENKLHPGAHSALRKLKSYFGKANAIWEVRNSFAFHYSIEAFNNHWQEAASEPTFELILGGTVGNNLHLAGELVANTALLKGINSNSKSYALSTFFDEVQSVTSSFMDFLEGTILVVLEEQFGPGLTGLGREEEISPKLRFNEVVIPFFAASNTS